MLSPNSVPIVPQPGTAEPQPTSKAGQGAVAAVTTGSAALDIREFDFNLGHHSEFFDGTQQPQQHFHHHHLSQGGIQGGLEQFHHHHHHHHQPEHTPPAFFGNWEHSLPQAHSGYIDLSAAPLTGPGVHTHEQSILPALPLVQRSRGPLPTSTSSSSGSIGTTRRRGRRLIGLRASHDTQTEVTGPSNSVSDLTTPLHWMARLSEINARLQALASLLPAQYEAVEDGVRSQSFPVDEMFQLTRQIADVLDQLCATYKDDQMPASEASVAGRTGQARLDGSDPGSAMFILSVYVMLLDLYHKVFALVRSEVFQQASTAAFALWKLPDVTIGSFAVESTPSLQMSLTIQLAEEFLSRLRRSTAALDPSNRSPSGNRSIFAGVVDASFLEIKSSEDSLRQELAALRDRIEEILEG